MKSMIPKLTECVSAFLRIRVFIHPAGLTTDRVGACVPLKKVS